MTSISIVGISLLTAWIVYNACCLARNYYKASKLGVPCVVVPISPDNQIWIALQTDFSNVLRYFPFSIISFTRHIRLGWEFHDRYRTHLRLGDAWVLVTPNRNWFHVSSASAIHDIQNRGQDFRWPVWMMGKFAFGHLSFHC